MTLSTFQQSLSGVLLPLGAAYSAAMTVRRMLWERDVLQRFVPPCPCVSVGNICWGGTGKTPLVDWLMGRAVEKGIQPVVLTRGYKASPSVLPLQVAPHHSPAEAGDEPLMLALRHPDAIVLVDPNRRRAAKEALRSLAPDLFILDDGMQHLAIGRHVELVVLRPQDLGDQWNCVIPHGSWREGEHALSRAHAFFLKIDAESFWKCTPLIKDRLQKLHKPVFSFQLQPTSLVRLDGTGTAMPQDFRKKPYALVTGVGNPEQVCESAIRFMGYPPDEHLAFTDHHDYTFKDVQSLEQRGIPVLCTTKDAVKLRRMPMSQLWCMHTQVVFGPSLWSSVPFPQWWDNWMKCATKAMTDPIPTIPAPEGFDPSAALDGDSYAIRIQKARQKSDSKPMEPPNEGTVSLHDFQKSTHGAVLHKNTPFNTPQPSGVATPPRPGRGLPPSQPVGKSRTWANDSQRPARPTTPGLPGGGRKPS